MNQAFRNEAHIHGELAKDPVIRYTPTSKQVATLTMVTRYKEKSEYHRVICWEDFAKKVEDLHKGDFLRVVGRLQTRSWEDAAKVKHYSTEVIAFQVVPGDEPVTPDATRPQSGTQVAKSILRPTENVHGLLSDDDLPAF
jgi:single-stranded DNA-binding protein